MNQSQYLKILKLTKRTLEEFKNWDEQEIPKLTSSNVSKNIKPKINNLNTSCTLDDLKNEVQNCKKCPLGNFRLTAVFGEGNPNAQIMFVGEGPGFEEDHQGRPFIGKAGQFLTKLIEAMGESRESVYIANIVKCHPMKDNSNPELRSNDRPPTELEVKACSTYLERQIEIIKPKVIITLGRPSISYFLQSDVAMSAIRGQFQDYKGIKVMPTYHPSYLIRNGCVIGKKDQSPQVKKLKKEVWSDLKKVMNYLKTGKI